MPATDPDTTAGCGARIDFTGLIKQLRVPDGFTVPTRLAYGDLVATAITRADLEDDVRGINASLALIRRTRGGDWPTGPVTEEFNFVDLVWHELEFRERTSFTYVVRDRHGHYLGCCYLYPMGARTPLDEQLIAHDVDVSWWVTPDAHQRGCYELLHRALRHWVAEELPFRAPYFSNAELPGD
jgi:hypothetical protein